jgi:hypothetical protein
MPHFQASLYISLAGFLSDFSLLLYLMTFLCATVHSVVISNTLAVPHFPFIMSVVVVVDT